MSKKIFEAKATVGPHRGHAAGKTDIEKAASQLASDAKYKVNKSMEEKGGRANMNPAQVAKAYLSQLASSPAPAAVKALAKKKLMGESYEVECFDFDITENVKNSVLSALTDVFVTEQEEEKFWIVVTDKKTGNRYRRRATLSKMAELRANPNISSVERTKYHPNEKDDEQGKKTASVKAGKGLNNDGNLANNYPPYHKVTRGDVIAGATGKDQMGGKKKVRKEEFLGEVAKETDDKKVTGKGVNNYKGGKNSVVKIFPKDVNEQSQVMPTAQNKPQPQKVEKDVVDPNEKRQISTLQQFQNKERQLNQQKLSAQKAGKIPVGSVQMNSFEPEGEDVQEVAPPGMEGTVRAMKKHPELSTGKTKEGKKKNIYALAWWMKGKGYKSHRKPSGAMKEEACGSDDEPKLKKSEGGAEDPRETPTKMNLVRNKLRAMGLKMSYEPEGEVIGEEDYDRMKDRHLERGGMGIRASQSPARKPTGKSQTPAEREAAMKKHKETSQKAMDLVRQSIIAKHGKGSLM